MGMFTFFVFYQKYPFCANLVQNVKIIILNQNLVPTITYKIFETNTSFLLVLTKLSIWPGDWALGYHSMGFRHFPEIS